MLLHPWDFSRQEYWSGLPLPPSEDPPQLGIEPRFPTSQVNSLSVEPQGKPKKTGVGSLFLLQRIFPIQELNQGLAKSRTRLSDFSFTFHFHALEKEMATHSSVLAWRIPGTGAWWTAVYGVAQSWTQLKRLSSSSSSNIMLLMYLSH